jgi:hypothetical protein
LFRDEDELRNRVMDWLKRQGFRVTKGVHLGSMELDIVAVAPLRISKEGVVRDSRGPYLYTFEAKITTTRKLVLDLIEQAITRLLLSDYVLVAVPSKAEVWVNSKTKEVIEPPQIIGRYALRVYSKKIGILSVDLGGEVKIVRAPQKSGLTQEELKEKVLKHLR